MDLRPKRQCSQEVVTVFSVSRREPQPQPPESWKTSSALGRRRSRGTTGRGSAPLTRRPQPLPERGGPPHATGRRLPAPPPRPAAHARVATASCSSSAPPPARTHAQRSPARSGSRHWRRRRRLRRRDSAGGSARHFLIRLLGAQSRQAPRRPRRRERACVVTCPAKSLAGGESASWGVPHFYDNGAEGGRAENETQVGRK